MHIRFGERSEETDDPTSHGVSDLLLPIHGFLQGNCSFSTKSNPDGGDFKWVEERFQLKLKASKELFHLFLKTDAFYDHIDEKGDLEVREGYIDLRPRSGTRESADR